MKLPNIIEEFINSITQKGAAKPMTAKEKWLLFFLAGLLLAVIFFPSGKKNDKELSSFTNIKNTYEEEEDMLTYQNSMGAHTRETEYEQYLSRKLEQILSEIDGAGEVQAWVTLSGSSERVLYEEKDMEEATLQEKDSVGGTRTEENHKSDKTIVIDSQGNPYVIKTLQPKVEGVLVVAEGAGNSVIKKNISEACEVLFGIEAHRIKVAKKKMEE